MLVLFDKYFVILFLQTEYVHFLINGFQIHIRLNYIWHICLQSQKRINQLLNLRTSDPYLLVLSGIVGLQKFLYKGYNLILGTSTLLISTVFVKIEMLLLLYGLWTVLLSLLYPRNKRCIYFNLIFKKLMIRLIGIAYLKLWHTWGSLNHLYFSSFGELQTMVM
jgi:hypothetical protein